MPNDVHKLVPNFDKDQLDAFIYSLRNIDYSNLNRQIRLETDSLSHKGRPAYSPDYDQDYAFKKLIRRIFIDDHVAVRYRMTGDVLALDDFVKPMIRELFQEFVNYIQVDMTKDYQYDAIKLEMQIRVGEKRR